jgi:NAD-dependent SIR2 family protein deacetylase
MTESKRVPKDLKPKRVKYINGNLRCLRCGNTWQVVDLNPERREVDCPVCAQCNDIREAIGRAA